MQWGGKVKHSCNHVPRWVIKIKGGMWFIFLSSFVVAPTCLVSSVQYVDVVLITLLRQQPFQRWATTFGNLTVIDLEDCALVWKKTKCSDEKLKN